MGVSMMCLYWPSIAVLCFGMPASWIGILEFCIMYAVCLFIIAVYMLMVLLYGPSIAVLSFGMPVSSFGSVVHYVWNSVYVASLPWVCP